MSNSKKRYRERKVKEIIRKLNITRPMKEEIIIQQALKLGYLSFDRKLLINELRKKGLLLDT